jgi:aromatic-amino-acid transaminase
MKRSPFSIIEQAPADPILGLTEAFNADKNPNKVNLGVGVYQDGNGKVPLLNVVKEASLKWVAEEKTKGYLPIDGIPAYNKLVQRLILGEDAVPIAEGRAVTVQSLGGTGGLKIGADFLRRFFSEAELWISDPSWENHRAIFESAGFNVKTYSYYDAVSHGLNFEGMTASIKDIPQGDIIVLHACCHNPTGVDLSEQQWQEIANIIQEKSLIPFLDFAYQGFGAGIDEDAFAPRLFAQMGIPCLIANSFSKSLSLYRERVGGLTVLTANEEESKRILSQIKRVIRTNYSNPSSHGAQVASMILGDPELHMRWEEELREMRERIWKMRSLFVKGLKEAGIQNDFSFIEQQRGMFSFTGLTQEQVQRLRDEFSIYSVKSSRVCVAAMNEKNIDYICKAIARCLA